MLIGYTYFEMNITKKMKGLHHKLPSGTGEQAVLN